MEQRLLDPLNAFEASLNTLVQSLTTTITFTAAPKAAQDLVTADDDLTAALITLQKHQENYQQILHLRAEKEALRNQIKHTIYECVRLKKDLAEIDSRIVEESDTEDEEETQQRQPIDYETLLAFATRIGKHNATAAQAAERESERFHQEAKDLQQNGSAMPNLTNGTHTGVSMSNAEDATKIALSQSKHTEEAHAKVTESRNIRLWERSMKTAPFPDAQILRHGVLGQLQVLREEAGEDAVQAHVEKLVRNSELKMPGEISPVLVPIESVPEEEPSAISALANLSERQPQPQRQRPLPSARKQVNLEFPGDDEDDVDEDEDGRM